MALAQRERVRPPSPLVCAALYERFSQIQFSLLALGRPITDLPGLVEYLELKTEILFFMQRIRTNLKTIETDGKFKKFVDQVESEIIVDALPMTTLFIPIAPEISVLSKNQPKPSRHYALAMGPLYGFRALLSPVYFEGVLIKELRHLYDLRRTGWASPMIRISRANEHESILLQAQYWRQMGSDLSNHIIRSALYALADAPSGPLWKAHVKKSEDVDYDLLEGLQKYINTQLDRDLRSDPAIVYNSILTPLGRVLLSKIETFPEERAIHPEEVQKVKEILKSITTYMPAARRLSNLVYDRVKKPSAEAVQAQGQWYSIQLTLDAYTHLYEKFIGTAGTRIIPEGNLKIEAEYNAWESHQTALKQEQACTTRH